MRKTIRNDDGGFALADILASIAILGTAGGIAMVSTDGVVADAQHASCRTEARIVRTAVLAYTAMHSAPPAEVNDLVPRYLATEPKLVAITFGAEPSYGWTVDCAQVTGVGTP